MDGHILFDERMVYAEDTMFSFLFGLICKGTLVLEACLYFYFQNPNSVMHSFNAVKHSWSMLRLAKEYKRYYENLSDETIKGNYIRAVQNFCRDLCFYCNDISDCRKILKKLKDNKYYPFGIYWKQYIIDKKLSALNNLLNWCFGLVSIEPVFWFCWYLCELLLKKNKKYKFDEKIYNDIYK